MTVTLTKRSVDGPAGDISNAPLSLRKLSEKAQFALSQAGMADLDMEILLIIDGSWSMGPYYAPNSDGLSIMDTLTDKVAAYAMITDADQQVPLLPFDNVVHGLSRITNKPRIIITPQNATGIVARELYGAKGTVWPTRDHMKGTHLGKALLRAAQIVEDSGRFTQVIVIGDGQPNDPDDSTHATIRLGKSGAQVKFISVVPLGRVPWLSEVDDLETRRPDIKRDYDNVSSVEVLDPVNIGALDFFKLVTKELPEHIDRAIAAGRLAK